MFNPKGRPRDAIKHTSYHKDNSKSARAAKRAEKRKYSTPKAPQPAKPSTRRFRRGDKVFVLGVGLRSAGNTCGLYSINDAKYIARTQCRLIREPVSASDLVAWHDYYFGDYYKVEDVLTLDEARELFSPLELLAYNITQEDL
jgi:hypothetical protein